MKGHKGNHHRMGRASGGVVDKEKSPSDVYEGGSSKVVKEARERKSGGRAKDGKMVAMQGTAAKANAGRKPRKSGGMVGADSRPMSSAAHGSPAKGRSVS